MTTSVHAAHRRIAEVLFAIGLAAYFVALHMLLVDGRWPRVTVAFVLTPWALGLAAFAARRLPRSGASLAIAALAGATWAGTNWASAYPERTVLFESVAFNVVLGGIFAGSLAIRGDALVTRLARIVRGADMPVRVVRYTRVVTAVWSAFFVGCAATSTLLYFTVSHQAWSVFANLLYWPLIVVLFVAEYATRRFVLSDIDHSTLMTSVRAYAQTHQKTVR